MATLTTYLLVSGADDHEAVRTHSVVTDHDLDLHDTQEGNADRIGRMTFVHETPLEDQSDLTEAAQTLSADFSEAVIVLCEVEERFDNIERLQTKIYRDGKEAGDIEHGYIFNIGGA